MSPGPAAPPHPPPPAAPSRFGAGIAAWGAIFGTTMFALSAAVMAILFMPGSIVAWALMFPVALLGEWFARRAFAERAWLLASLMAAMALPPVWAGASDALQTAIVSTNSLTHRDGVVLGPFFFLCGGFAVLPIALVLAWKPRRGLSVVFRGLSYAAVAAAAALVVVGSVRALRKPSPDGYLGHVPLVATLPYTPHAVADAPGVHLARHDDGPDPCAFDVTLADDRGAPLDQVFTSGARSACSPIGLREDSANGYWIFTDEAGREPSPLIAVDMKTHASVALDARVLARSLSAPPAWIGLAAAGVLGAVVWLVVGKRKIAALRDRAEALPATHLGQGMVRLDDDAPPFFVERAASLAPGPVLLVGAVKAAATAYRENSVPVTARAVAPGTVDSAKSALSSEIASQHAFALVCAALGAVPLVVAACASLVF